MTLYSYHETLVTAQVDGPTLTAAAAASCIPPGAVFGLTNNYWKFIGQKINIRASGRISSVITTPGTARFDVRLGGTVVFDSQAILLDTVAAHTNVGWYLDIDMTVRSVTAATCNFFGQGTWTCEDILGVPATAPKGVLSAMLPWNAAPAVGGNVNFASALALDMFFTQTVATGSMTLHQYEVTVKN